LEGHRWYSARFGIALGAGLAALRIGFVGLYCSAFEAFKQLNCLMVGNDNINGSLWSEEKAEGGCLRHHPAKGEEVVVARVE
jgi:hypothetical protein